MNIATENSLNLICNSMQSDCIFHRQNDAGNLVSFQSNGFTSIYAIHQMIAAENYVRKATNLKQPSFQFDRPIHGIRLIKGNASGAAFYSHLKMGPMFIPENHEASVFSSALWNAKTQVGLFSVPMTGHPMSPVAPNGLVEGELINFCTDYLAQPGMKKKINSAVTERKNEISKIIKKSILRLTKYHQMFPLLQVVAIDLYAPSTAIKKSLIVDSSAEIDRFSKNLKNAVGSNLVDFFWKRYWLPEVGYHFHVKIIVDSGTQPYQKQPFDIIKNCWEQATEGSGYSFLYKETSPDSYRSWGIGCLNEASLSALTLGIKAMHLRDLYLRLHNSGTEQHSGMGDGPEKMKCKTSSDRILQKKQELEAKEEESIYAECLKLLRKNYC